ncbi:carboxymuconolactone decarboxylase family protein [Vibrio tarriae]|uniref:Alkylhydroperoxidase n=1 Tax=Vibrio tarriae TaxID=2014742 RepID=A0AAU8WPT6_9VIBR|nr:carboxymuconolactone decarboxylase family protein [Vibrio tarriae]EGQ9890310.1 carboxymuconolactone decarboxylase family protein [Vibrio cholerae]ASK54170.1 alkylhydroperoxidase [Vibrio tarriae]EJL6631435.1 carboxymuconolactone decarboxylase family protein [Vibrio cholerae]EKF9880721.1 carboxymuconolactone decarboxylase family protein [Vibrio cholerae]ELH0900136.1 carboxymuconolactone decarboxylase family protein [Vibrio cholerae]
MSRITPVSQPQGEAAVTLNAIKQKIGMVPNLYATVAHSSTVLNAYLAFSEALSQGRLTAKQRELIALAVGQANACQYCLSAHTMISRSTGLSDEQILTARQGTAANGLDNALVQLAVSLVKQRGVITDEQLEAARKQGVDEGLVFEVLAQVSANTFTNYANHVAGTDIDFPAVNVQL